MIVPNLTERIAWYQARMKPDDPTMGDGIQGWTITAEYAPRLTVDGAEVWGCMCSPSLLPAVRGLTGEDIAAKRAHIIVRTPERAADIAEVERTLLHELGHVLVAPMQSTNVAAEENAMHSFDALFAKLSPEQGQALARAFQNPKARAYRATNGDTMADPTKAPPGDTAPEGEAKKQEGAGGGATVAEIQKKIVEAVLAGQPTEELGKALVAAMAMAGAEAAAEPPSTPTPAPAPTAPTMGMKPEDAYARKIAEVQKEAIEAIIEANPHLDDKQRAMARKQATAKDARELVSTYPRPSTEPGGSGAPKMGADGHPAKGGLGGSTTSVRLRALQASPEVHARLRRATSDADTVGLELDTFGRVLVYSPTQHLREMAHQIRAEQEKARAA